MAYFPGFQHCSFFRTPEWRWRRAQWLVTNGRNFSSRRDDEATRDALRLLRDMGGRRHRPRERTLAKHHPEIWQAYHLWVSGGKTRLMVEARILARQLSATIEAMTDVPAPVIDIFQALFFHVREHINARDWILMHAIGLKTLRGSVVPTAEFVLKTLAYHGGPVVLEKVAPYLLDGRDLFEPSLDLSTPEGRTEQKVRLAIATLMLPHDSVTDYKLQKVLLILRERERQQPFRDAPRSILAKNLDFRLRQLVADAPTEHVTEQKRTTLAPVAAATRKCA
jgi:hypothetical protein